MEQELLQKLINHALKLLTRRHQSEKEIRTKLSRYLYKKNVSEASLYIDEVISFLNRKKLLNDTLFAEMFSRDRQLLKPRSKKMLRMELTQKGMDDETIEKALDEYDEEEAVKRIIERKKHYSQDKLTQYLIQLGFPIDLIRTTIREPGHQGN
jgi:regulatory protein